MRYMMAILGDEQAQAKAPKEAIEKMFAEFEAYTKAMIAAGVRIDGFALTPSSEGLRVQVRGGQRKVIDGPFTETKEVLGGLYILEVKSVEEAIDWAARCPSSAYGTLELRPLLELPY